MYYCEKADTVEFMVTVCYLGTGYRYDFVFTHTLPGRQCKREGSGRGLVHGYGVGLMTLGSLLRFSHRGWFAFEVR